MIQRSEGTNSAYRRSVSSTAGLGVAVDMKTLLGLPRSWERLARNRSLSAENEKSSMEKHLIEHGVICYLNCAREFNAALAPPWPEGQEHPSGDRR